MLARQSTYRLRRPELVISMAWLPSVVLRQPRRQSLAPRTQGSARARVDTLKLQHLTLQYILRRATLLVRNQTKSSQKANKLYRYGSILLLSAPPVTPCSNVRQLVSVN